MRYRCCVYGSSQGGAPCRRVTASAYRKRAGDDAVLLLGTAGIGIGLITMLRARSLKSLRSPASSYKAPMNSIEGDDWSRSSFHVGERGTRGRHDEATVERG
jgi:hypothetical protein